MSKKFENFLIALFIVLIILFFSLNYWETYFDKEIDCISFTLGESEYKPCKVRLLGKFNKSVLLDDYISYIIYIDGKRYPRKEDYSKDILTPVDEIKSFCNYYDRNTAIYIRYNYWKKDLDDIIMKDVSFGVLFFKNKNFDDIIIGINKMNEEGKSTWTNKYGYEVIVSGNDMEGASKCFKKLNMTVHDEKGNLDTEFGSEK